jgi:dihydroorotate dehydrogenase
MLYTPYYDPEKTYEDNFNQGPFGDFADGEKFENKDEPKYKLFDLPVYLPFGIPAGPLLNGKFVKAALDKGFNIVTYKTVRSRQYSCSQWPNVLGVQINGDLTLDLAEKGVVGNHKYVEPLSITNSFGVPSFDPEFWQKDLSETVKYAKKGQIVIGSFQGTTNTEHDPVAYVEDFVNLARMIKKTGVKVLEVNLSCPNEGTTDLLCFDLKRTKEIAEAIKNEIGDTPLIIKIAYFQEQEQLEKLVDYVGKTVDGIAAINTIPAKIFDKNGNQALPGNNRLKSGVCGSAIKWAGLEMVKRLKNLRDQKGLSFTILGVGGVTRPEDYQAYKNAGADVVMSATGSMWNPYLAQEIKNLK